MLAKLWQQIEAGEPALWLGQPVEPAQAALFGQLLQRRVLRHAGEVTTWDVCDGCDCGRDDRPIRWRDGKPVATCILDHNRDLALSADDIISFLISIPDLVAVSAEASGFSDPPEEIDSGIWRIGRAEGGPVVIIIPSRMAMRRHGLLGTLRQTEPLQDILLLGPSLPEQQRAAYSRQGVHHAILYQRCKDATPNPLSLDLTVSAATPTTKIRLRLSTSDSKVILDGRVAELPPRRFQLLLLLARELLAGRPLVSAAKINQSLFSSTTAPTRARGLVLELRSHLTDHLQAPVGLIETRANLGYTIKLTAKELTIED